jgi:hypothetical protein
VFLILLLLLLLLLLFLLKSTPFPFLEKRAFTTGNTKEEEK